jgi:hypothetical protein
LDTQDQIIPEDDKGVDRKELLAQQFDEVETATNRKASHAPKTASM